MSHTPIFIRKVLTKQKINNMMSFMMPVEDVLKCDEDPLYKAEIIAIIKKKNPKKTKWLEKKTQRVIDNYPGVNHADESACKKLKEQMEYAFFGYGFYPDEFLFFDLGGENSDLSRFRSFVSETERWTFRFAANDFTNSLLSDKATSYAKFKEYYHRDVVLIDSNEAWESFCAFIEKHPRFVYKKARSSRGDGVRLIENAGDKKAFFKKMRKDHRVLLEECISQSDDMAKFNNTSVNTVRISTYYTCDGIIAKHSFFRSGRTGSFIDNAAKGGIFAVTDANTGTIISDGYDEYGNVYKSHPDSGTVFRGYSFPEWESAVDICKNIAKELPSVKYISADLAHTADGWVVVELNPSGQYLHQAGQKEGFRKELSYLIEHMDLMTTYKLRSYH